MKKIAALRYYILSFFILEALCFGLLHSYFRSARADYLSEQTKHLEVHYKAVFNSYSMLTRAVFRDFMNGPDITELLSKASQADEAARKPLREALYKKTFPFYRKLADEHLKVLQFHLPDGTSFLRVHKPEDYGDNLFAARPIVKAVNTRKTYIEGFEMGKIFSGFRFVYPLSYKGAHAGSVETAIAFKGIRKEMEQLYPSEFILLLKKSIFKERVWEREKPNYIPSDLSDYYVYEKAEMSLDEEEHIEHINAATLQNISRLLKNKITPDIRSEQTFAAYTEFDGIYYVASFLPVKNIEGRVEGYIVSFSKDFMIGAYNRNFYLILIPVTLLIMTSLFFLQTYLEKQKQIIEQNNLFQATINSLPYPFYVINVLDYTVELANKSACDKCLLGNITCHELTHHKDVPCGHDVHPCPLKMVMETGKPAAVEHIHFDAQGAMRNVEVHGYPIFNHNGIITKFIEYSIDITEKKRLEEELLRVKKLETVGILAGGIAHDFNNVLNAICGNISLIELYEPSDSRINDALKEAEKACDLAKELGARLITFAKGGDPLKKLTSISGIIKETVFNLVKDTNYSCEIALSEDLYPVKADERQIRQVISNIVTNAKEVMPTGGVIKISGSNIEVEKNESLHLKEGKYIKISIEDHGTGIPEENLPKIFDPYFSTKDTYSQRGMGLGLAVCYSIIKKHDGLIAVQSVIGKGTTFHIYLPASFA